MMRGGQLLQLDLELPWGVQRAAAVVVQKCGSSETRSPTCTVAHVHVHVCGSELGPRLERMR
jgi:hypothetical protein